MCPSKHGQNKNNGVLPSLPDLFRATNSKDGVFVDSCSEKIHSDMSARIAERQNQLRQESPHGVPLSCVPLSWTTIFEEVVPKKNGRVLGIVSINDVPRAISSYAQRQST